MITTFYPPYSFGGDGIFIYRLSNELAGRGHRVDVIHCLDAYRLKANSHSGPWPNHPNIKVYKLKSRSASFSSLYTQQTGVPYFRKTIKNCLENNKYDVIHYHNISLIGIAALKYGRAIKLLTLHEYWLVCPTHVLWKYNREPCKKRNCLLCTLRAKRPPQLWRYFGMVERTARYIDGFIAPSRFAMNKHHELGLDVPINHIPHFLPQKKIATDSIPKEKSLQMKRRYFLFVGRLEKFKGLQNLIRVFENYKKYDLFIAGAGEYMDVLKQIADNAHHIKFFGRLDEETLRELYRNAIAVIVPSICYEVFGIIIIESFMMKTPVIVNNIGGMPEIIEDSSGGFVYRSNDELISAMDLLAKDADLRSEMGNRGYQAYLKYWSEEVHIRKYLDYINELQQKRN